MSRLRRRLRKQMPQESPIDLNAHAARIEVVVRRARATHLGPVRQSRKESK